MSLRYTINERLAETRERIDARDSRRFGLTLMAVLAVVLTLVISSNYLPSRHHFEAGEISEEEVVAPRSVIFEDREATEELRRQVSTLVQPVYSVNPTALSSVVADVNGLFEAAVMAKSALAPTTTVPPGSSTTGTLDLGDQVDVTESTEPLVNIGLARARLRQEVPATVSDDTLVFVLEATPETVQRLQADISNVLRVLYAGSVTQVDLDSVREKLRVQVQPLSGGSEYQTAVLEVASAYLRPNQVYDDEATRARRDQSMQEVAPVTISVLKGERIIQPGDAITAQKMLALQALGLQGKSLGWEIWLGSFIVVVLQLLVLAGLLTRTNRPVLENNTLMLALTTLIVLFALMARIVVIPPLSPYLVPLAAMAMITSIITKPRTALLLVSLQALNIGLMTGVDFGYVLVALITAVFSLYPVSHLAQRSELLSAGALVAVVAGAAVFAAEMLREAPVLDALRASLWGLGNGVLSMVITVIVLMIYEPLFNLSTPLRLLELANPAQPLLRKLMQVAPGTYNHSILMGNLAESAAEAIGADPLLARVGAYYHDIGKTLRPEYFIENQLHISNPHDKMNPNLSKLAITAHVKDGEDLARKYGLPAPVLDIIRQHHGTSVLSYFYHKAKESAGGDVTEESYRYEQEKPTSPEAAIIMLADSVEAAAKALREPTEKKMQGLIREIFKQKVDDGQLDRSQLTFGDLHKIQEVFENGLRGLAGHRIEYPKEGAGHESRLPRAVAGGGGTVLGGGARSARVRKFPLAPAPPPSDGEERIPDDS
ncbi:MAG: HDIG domain-containing protein [Actinobacteria bacterium]|nr:HDIG domain-containing protein [Actinomycetota bacterium]